MDAAGLKSQYRKYRSRNIKYWSRNIRRFVPGVKRAALQSISNRKSRFDVKIGLKNLCIVRRRVIELSRGRPVDGQAEPEWIGRASVRNLY